MAKIPLRTYVKEIENQIERGEIDQAIAHAKNILKSYPKNIDTYRLLGKAYLESQHYSEAADILQRVLSVIPDDFISQIGMSIIREDEGNMDAAIWHMERAYEVQPFNPAVQEELRRLYGRRDGIEPPKIRLTRGALVRMYARGELYTQAIAETRAALAEDPQRMDLLVLLARLYYLSGHKNDAAEVCSELIRKLPYCYEANHLLAEFLPETNRADEAQKFLQRIYALDPYAAFISPTAPTSDQVPDQAVMVEQFTWESAMEEARTPDWTRNVGVEWEETPEEALPDWLNTLKPDTPSAPAQTPESELNQHTSAPAAETEGAEFSKDELIPDWMKDAGWIPSDRKADEIMASQPESGEEEILPADLPDWVQSIAPQEAGEPADTDERNDWLESILSEPGGSNGKETGIVPPPELEKDESQQGLPDWVTGAGTGTQIPAGEELPAADLPDWFAQMDEQKQPGETQPENEQKPAEFEGLPDWSQLGEPSVVEPGPDAEKAPDWLQTFESDTPAGTEQATGATDWLHSFETETPAKAEQADEVPDWLTSVEPESQSKSDDVHGLTDWLRSVQPEAKDTSAAEEAAAEVPAAEAEIPDWLQSVSGDEKEIPMAEAAEVPQEPGLVEPLSAETSPEMPSEISVGAEETAAPAPAAAPDFTDMDAAMAWLESLAAKQGADEATLVTPPEQRLEQPPDWVTKEMEGAELALPEAEAEQLGAVEELPARDEQPVLETDEIVAELPDWQQSNAAEAVPTLAAEELAAQEELAALEEPVLKEDVLSAAEDIVADLPDWSQAGVVEEKAPTGEAPEQAGATMPDFSDMDAAMAWLESLAAKQGADEATLVTPPEQRLEQPPEWVMKETEGAEPAVHASDFEETLAPEEPALPELATDHAAEWTEQNEAITQTPSQPEAAMPDFSDMDSAMAWLESLAAKQGADEATLVTPPEQRLEQPPDWVSREMEAQAPAQPEVIEPAAYEPAELEPADREPEIVSPADEILAAAVAEDESAPIEEAILPDWLQEAIEEKAPAGDVLETFAAPEITIENLPESSSENEQQATQAPPGEAQAAPAAEMDLDAAFAWLESLAEKQGADEGTLVTAPEERLETPPDWVQEQVVEAETHSAEELAETAAIEQPTAEEETIFEEAAAVDQLPVEPPTAEESAAVAEEPADTVPDWLASIGQEEVVESDHAEETVPWPGETDAAVEQPAAGEQIPDWLQIAGETEPGSTGTTPGESESIPDWLTNLEQESEPEAFPQELEMPPVPADFSSAWEPEEEISQPAAKEPAAWVPSAQAPETSSIAEIQSALGSGDLDRALAGYNNLIQNGEHLEETIHDLRDALYRYPVDISIWQTLGDAYARNNQLQEALDAYTKAEELLR